MGRLFPGGTNLTLSGLKTDRVMVKNLFCIHTFQYGAHSNQRRLFALGLDYIHNASFKHETLAFSALEFNDKNIHISILKKL
jgi:hypothetical protein